jgi:hypothetical protein
MSELSEPKRKRRSKPAKVKNVSEREMRDAAYFLWEHEGRPDGRALDHWLRVAGQRPGDQEKMAG